MIDDSFTCIDWSMNRIKYFQETRKFEEDSYDVFIFYILVPEQYVKHVFAFESNLN